MKRLSEENVKKILASEYQALNTRKEELKEKTKNRNFNVQEKQLLFKSITDKEAMQIEIVRIWAKLFDTGIFSLNEIIKELDK